MLLATSAASATYNAGVVPGFAGTARAGNMTDGVFVVRPGVEDDRAGIAQRCAQLCSTDLGTACDIAQHPIEDARHIARMR